jgi:hypothetical protein
LQEQDYRRNLMIFQDKLTSLKPGAGEEARTLDLNLGKVALYQLSYSRFAFRAASFTTGTHYRSSMRHVKEGSLPINVKPIFL